MAEFLNTFSLHDASFEAIVVEEDRTDLVVQPAAFHMSRVPDEIHRLIISMTGVSAIQKGEPGVAGIAPIDQAVSEPDIEGKAEMSLSFIYGGFWLSIVHAPIVAIRSVDSSGGFVPIDI